MHVHLIFHISNWGEDVKGKSAYSYTFLHLLYVTLGQYFRCMISKHNLTISEHGQSHTQSNNLSCHTSLFTTYLT